MELRNAACGILAVWAVATAAPVIAANQVRGGNFLITYIVADLDTNT